MRAVSFLVFLSVSISTFVLAHPHRLYPHGPHPHPYPRAEQRRVHYSHKGGPRPSTNANTQDLRVPLANYNGSANLQAYHPSKEEIQAIKDQVTKMFGAVGGSIGVTGKFSPVAAASNPLQGVIAAFVAPYGFVGYVSRELTSYFHTTPLTNDLSKAAMVTLPSTNPGANFNLAIANSSAPLLGVIEGYSGPNWGHGNPGYGTMTVVQNSQFPASNTNNPTGLPSESNIWTMNVSTGELTSVWFNNDGTKVGCTMFYDATYGDMNFTGDLPAYLKVYPDNCYITTLYFVPLSYFGY